METQALNLLNQGRHPLQGPIGSLPARRETPQLAPAADEPFTPDWVADEPPSRADRGPRAREPYPGDPQDAEPEPPRRRALPGRRMVLGGGGPVTGDGPVRTSPTRSGPCRTGVRTGPTGASASPNDC
nr:hypothetical protein [Streptomyces sp. S1D4-11]